MKEIMSLNWNSLPFVDVPTIERKKRRMNNNNEYHLLRIKNALAMIEESLRELFKQSLYIPPQKRQRLRDMQEFYHIKQLPTIVGIGRSTIYLKIKNNTFPKPVQISDNRVAWRKIEIHKWLDKK